MTAIQAIARLAGAVSGQRPSQRALAQGIILLVLAILTVCPLIFLFRAALTPSGTMPFETGDITFQNFVDAFVKAQLLDVIGNTLLYAAGSMTLGVSVACAIAWLVERTNIPLRTPIRIGMFLWMPIPTLVMAFGWILLINPGNGFLNVTVRDFLGLEENPFTIYSMSAMVIVTGLAIVPTAFAMIAGLLRNMDPQLESAAVVHGSRRSVVLRRVTLPLLAPGLASVAILMFMVMIQVFDAPLVIGLSAKIPVLSTRIYLLSSSELGTPNYGLAAAVGLIFLLLALVLMAAYFRLVRQGERFRVVTGKGYRPRLLNLGGWRYAALTGVGLYFATMLMPFLMLLWTSLLPFYQNPSVAALQRISLANYEKVLSNSTVIDAIGFTLLLVLCSATIVTLLSLVISWFSVRSKTAFSRWIEVLAFAPMAIPAAVLAIAILLVYMRTPIYGTIWVIVLAHATVFLPFGARTMNAALLQVHQELENAALVSGAGWTTMLRRVIYPLLKPHIVNSWLWVAAHSARDITFPLFLITTSNIVLASEIWLLWDKPNWPGAAALAMLLVFGLLALVIPLQVMASRSAQNDL